MPSCLQQSGTEQRQIYDYFMNQERIPLLHEDYALSGDLTYRELRAMAGEPPRNWGDRQWLATEHMVAMAPNAPVTTPQKLQQRLQQLLPENSPLILTMRQLAEFILELPKKVVAKMNHRLVPAETFTIYDDLLGRPSRAVPSLITLSFPTKLGALREESNDPSAVCSVESESQAQDYFVAEVCPLMILRELICHDRSMPNYFKDLPGLYFDAAAAMAAQVDAERHMSMRFNFLM